MRAVLLIPLFLLTALSCSENPVRDDTIEPLTAWITTGDQSRLLEEHSVREARPVGGARTVTVEVNRAERYQEMEGFGAAITNSAAYVIRQSPRRDEIMADLFSQAGIGITYVRLPMGASDFVAPPAYTYNDLPQGETDPEMERFSIAPDRAVVLPTVKAALDLNPSLRIMASPWSAPAWMKNPTTLNGGSLRPEYYDAYANYFVRFIHAYASEGIPIDAVTPQNEPRHTTNSYPTMGMTAVQQAEFVGQHLGPAFDANEIDAKILIWDHNWDMEDYPMTVLADEQARSYAHGVAWHCYGGDVAAQSRVHHAYPGIATYFTECSGGAWDSNFASVLSWNARNLFIGSVRNWSRAVLLWNLALNENHGPHRGGCSNCRGVVTVRSDGTHAREPEYYIIGHFSKFVRPGAYRIGSSTFPGDVETVAFENPDGSLILAVLNAGGAAVNLDVASGDTTFRYASVPPRSLLTVVW